MSLKRPHTHSAYMEFSKLRSEAPYNLATSGVSNCSLGELTLDMDALELHGKTIYGYQPLLEAIGRMKGVPADCVVEAAGTSMANHLAMAALFAHGEEVLIEEPTYELLLNAAHYLGAKVRRFQRAEDHHYALDLAEIERNLTPRTRLIVLTNMHNPSSALIPEESLRAVGELARSVGAHVLVDEVYLELAHHPPIASAFHYGHHFVTTGSLTKAYGLGGLRCGWILAEPALATRMWRLNDLFAATPVHLAELLSVQAIEQVDVLAARADRLIQANRQTWMEVMSGHPAIDGALPDVGTTVFPRLRQGDASSFCEFLRDEYQTSVVPGSYFERPERFRVGLGGEVAMTREGLLRLAQALTHWRKRDT